MVQEARVGLAVGPMMAGQWNGAGAGWYACRGALQMIGNQLGSMPTKEVHRRVRGAGSNPTPQAGIVKASQQYQISQRSSKRIDQSQFGPLLHPHAPGYVSASCIIVGTKSVPKTSVQSQFKPCRP